QCLMVGGRSLWDRYDNGDNLLFCKEDFADPGASPLFRELWQLQTPFAHSLVGNLILACKEPMAQVPTVDALFSDENTVVRLTAEQQQAVEKLMELKVAKPVPTAQAVKAGEWWKSPAATEKAAPSTPATVAAEKASRAST